MNWFRKLTRYEEVLPTLRDYYEHDARRRDQNPRSYWKLQEREVFLEYLLKEQRHDLLEIGAGPGWDSLFFQEAGINTYATDLSFEMASLCSDKGLESCVMEFMHPAFTAATFDAMFALNCLLHVPRSDIERVLVALRRVIKPGGLLFIGAYGGKSQQGLIDPDDPKDPRFFATYTDYEVIDIVSSYFDLVRFQAVDSGHYRSGLHFQSMIWRKRT
jgi:SAM-dependent methyltransferase